MVKQHNGLASTAGNGDLPADHRNEILIPDHDHDITTSYNND